MHSTHTVSILEVPPEAFGAVAAAFAEADMRQLRDRTMDDGAIILTGIALRAKSE